jgi:hypothetical protein
MVACFLIEREKSLLDELVTMHHAYLVGLERRARNSFREQRFAAHRDLRKNMAVLVALGEALLVAPGGMTIDAFRDAHVDMTRLRAAIEGCTSFERLETRGLLDAMLARHSWLKKYLPSFLRLPFQGGDGTGPLLGAIAHALSCYERDRPVGKAAPTQFARGFWAKALDTTMVRGAPDGRVWELALAFETDEALRRGDLFPPAVEITEPSGTSSTVLSAGNRSATSPTSPCNYRLTRNALSTSCAQSSTKRPIGSVCSSAFERRRSTS